MKDLTALQAEAVRLRTEKQMTIYQIAIALGVQKDKVGRWCKGIKVPAHCPKPMEYQQPPKWRPDTRPLGARLLGDPPFERSALAQKHGQEAQ